MNISIVISKISNRLENPNKIQATRELDIYNKKVLLPWRFSILKGSNNKRSVIIWLKNVGWRAEEWSNLLKDLGLS